MSFKLRLQLPYSFLQGFLYQKYMMLLIRQSNKIFRAIIILDSIEMMPHFSLFKRSSQFFFQYRPSVEFYLKWKEIDRPQKKAK